MLPRINTRAPSSMTGGSPCSSGAVITADDARRRPGPSAWLAVYLDAMAERVDIEASGLLDGLEGEARAERAELIDWLLDRDISVEQIRGAFAPMLLATRRVMGDD